MSATAGPMDTAMALSMLKVRPGDLSREQSESFEERGFFVVEGVYSAQYCHAMAKEFDRLADKEGVLGGAEVHTEPGAQRVSDIYNKSTVFDATLTCKPLLAAAFNLLGEIRIHGDNMREPKVGYGEQPLHADVPTEALRKWRLVNSLHIFDDMNATNGATRVVPGSHRWAPINIPLVNVDDSVAPPEDQERGPVPNDPMADHPDQVIVTAPAGSVAVFNAHVWHGGTKRTSKARRRVLHLSICRRELPQMIERRQTATDELRARLSDVQRWLLDI